MIWRAGQFEYVFPRPALIMGIINVTPDSFSEGGRYPDALSAVEHGIKLAAEGADILDIGGESTRPGAQFVSEDEEMRRVLPVVRQLRERVRIPLSVDTTKVEVARACLDAGASIINDIGANRTEPGLWETVAAARAGYVIMHMLGAPPTMHLNPQYKDVVQEVGGFLAERLERVARFGVGAEQVVLDVGLGFGKNLAHNLQLLGSLQFFRLYQRPLLLGASRKSFIGQVTGQANPADRLPGSLACACWAVLEGVQIIRVHDVAATKQAVVMTEALAKQSQNVFGSDTIRGRL